VRRWSNLLADERVQQRRLARPHLAGDRNAPRGVDAGDGKVTDESRVLADAWVGTGTDRSGSVD